MKSKRTDRGESKKVREARMNYQHAQGGVLVGAVAFYQDLISAEKFKEYVQKYRQATSEYETLRYPNGLQ